MTITITTDDVISALKKAIQVQGDGHKQPRFQDYKPGEMPKMLDPGDGDGACRYGDPLTGQPSCIVGWALFNINRDIFHQFAEVDGWAGKLLDDIEKSNVASFSPPARALLENTQSRADEGKTWRESVDYGLTRLV